MTERPLAYGSHPMWPCEDTCSACGLPGVVIKGLGSVDCTGFRALASGKVDNDGNPWSASSPQAPSYYQTLKAEMGMGAGGGNWCRSWGIDLSTKPSRAVALLYDGESFTPITAEQVPWFDAEASRRACKRIAYEGRRNRIAKLRQHHDDMARMAEPSQFKPFAELTTAERLQRAMSAQDGSHSKLLGWPR